MKKSFLGLLCLLCLTIPAYPQDIYGPQPTSVGTSPVGQIQGTTTNDNASSGKIGEIVSATVVSGSAVPLTSGTAATVVSISLSAGDWDVTGVVAYSLNGSTVGTRYISGTNTTAATISPTVGNNTDISANFITGSGETFTIPTVRYSLASTTTVYLVGFSSFTVSNMSAYGTIRARRVR